MTDVEKINLAIECCAEAWEITADEIKSKRKDMFIVYPRWASRYLMVSYVESDVKRLARLAGVERTGIIYAVSKAKDESDVGFQKRLLKAAKLFGDKIEQPIETMP